MLYPLSALILAALVSIKLMSSADAKQQSPKSRLSSHCTRSFSQPLTADQFKLREAMFHRGGRKEEETAYNPGAKFSGWYSILSI